MCVCVCTDVCRWYGDNSRATPRLTSPHLVSPRRWNRRGERKRDYSARVGMKREINEPNDQLCNDNSPGKVEHRIVFFSDVSTCRVTAAALILASPFPVAKFHSYRTKGFASLARRQRACETNGRGSGQVVLESGGFERFSYDREIVLTTGSSLGREFLDPSEISILWRKISS